METYTENPRKWFVKTFEEPISEKKITLFNTKKGNIQICKQNSLSVENEYIVYKLRKYKEKVKATRNKTSNLYKKIHWLKKNLIFCFQSSAFYHYFLPYCYMQHVMDGCYL